jgi:hypothetical protein
LQHLGVKEAVEHPSSLSEVADGQALAEAGFDEGFEEGDVIKVVLATGVDLGDIEMQLVGQGDLVFHQLRVLPDVLKLLGGEFIRLAEDIHGQFKAANAQHAKLVDFVGYLRVIKIPPLSQLPNVGLWELLQYGAEMGCPGFRRVEGLQPDVEVLGVAERPWAITAMPPSKTTR